MEPIFFDLEASGLGDDSYPIEIAWKCPRSGMNDSFLINPETAPNWDFWDEYAEELHGLEYERLLAEGMDVVVACLRLNSALEGKTLISDAVNFDRFWMDRLYQAADIEPTFTMAGLDLLLSQEELVRYDEVARTQFRSHRAMGDVDDLIAALREVNAELL